jgi:hypothetical protein
MAADERFSTRPTRGSVFISYSHADAPWVDAITAACARLQISVWRDRDSIIGGRRWRETTTAAIRGASVFVACLSGNYFRNPESFIVDELAVALDEVARRPGDRSWLVPVKIGRYDEADVLPALRRTLHDLHVVDVTADVEAGFSELLSLLLQLTKPDEYWRLLLRQRLEAHVRSQIEHFTSSSTLRVTPVEERWTALLDDPVITPLSTAFIQVLEKADMTKTHQVEHIDLPDTTLFVSCIPYLDSDRFKIALPTSGDDLPDRYFQFLLEQERNMMRLQGWQRRDLVHVLYFTSGDEWILDLCLVTSFDLDLLIAGYLVKQRGATAGTSGKIPISYEQLYPTYVTNSIEHSRFVNVLRQEQLSAHRS